MAYRRCLLYKATTALWSLAACCGRQGGALRKAGPPNMPQSPLYTQSPCLV